jgi:uncharacterized protein
MNSNGIPRRDFFRTTLAGAAAACAPATLAFGAAAKAPLPPSLGMSFRIEGPVGNYLSGVTGQWLKIAPFSNPAMLDMLADRDRKPLREMVPWAGEFAGKYLTAAVLVWRVTGDDSLRQLIVRFVERLTQLQADDGYLGPWPKDNRLTGRAPNIGDKGGETWDAWGHYHVMIGLLLWHESSGDPAALNCACRMADLICRKFETARLVDTGSTEMNLAPIHSLALLYRRTGQERYLKQAQKICDEFSATGPDGKFLAGDYLNAALAGKEFFQMPKPRWESLHPIMGLAELYRATGDDKYRRAFEHIWWSIVKLDRHNNGGFSSGEQAQGNPYHQGAIETCCTIAWTALSIEMLRLTGNSIVADELELSTLNSVLGLHSPTGRWVTYNTPMDGVRKASAHDIVFQARAGSPELNCCSVNGARGLGMISDWAVVPTETGLNLNWYGPSVITAKLSSGEEVKLTQQTAYPADGAILLQIDPVRSRKFTLNLRIPQWSTTTRIQLNGKSAGQAKPGTYFSMERKWKRGDIVQIDLDFSYHFWAGERECANRASIYRGPLLLAYDRRFNKMDPDAVPALDAAGLAGTVVKSDAWMAPMLLIEFNAGGQTLRLCDFASAGNGGSPYRSWLEIKSVPPAEYSPRNTFRTKRV